MKKNSLLTLIIAFFFAGSMGLMGCAEAPQTKVDEAQAALAAADSAEADVYAADQYVAAQDSFAAAQAEIETQNAAFGLSRDYSRAEALLQSVVDLANASTEQVASRKEETRLEAEMLLAEAQTVVAQAQELAAKAPQAAEGDVAAVSFQQDAGSAQTLLDEAAAAQMNGEFAKARDLAKEAIEKANGLIAQAGQAAGQPRS